MDVDAASGRGAQHSEAKKQELMKNNQCFYCEIQGHRARECRKKAADRHLSESGRADNPKKGGPSPPIYNRASEETPKLSMEETVQMMKDHMDEFSEDTKLSMIQALMLKDFYPAQN